MKNKHFKLTLFRECNKICNCITKKKVLSFSLLPIYIQCVFLYLCNKTALHNHTHIILMIIKIGMTFTFNAGNLYI